MLVFLFTDGADKLKYGTIVNGMYTQHSLGNNQYPMSLEKAVDILSNHKIDKAYYEDKKKCSKRFQENDQDDTPDKEK